MTEQSWGMVERLVEVLGKLQVGSSLEEQAVAALEACHLADLELALLTAINALDYAVTNDPDEQRKQFYSSTKLVCDCALTSIGDRT